MKYLGKNRRFVLGKFVKTCGELDLETVWQGDTGFEHRACFFDRQFQKMKCDLSDKFRCLVDEVESIWSSGAPDIGDFSQI